MCFTKKKKMHFKKQHTKSSCLFSYKNLIFLKLQNERLTPENPINSFINMNVFLILMSVYVVSYRKLFTARSVSWSLQQQQVQRRTVCGRTTALFSTVRGCDVILTLVHRWVTVHRSLLYTAFLSLTVNMTWADHQDPHCVPQNSCCPHKVEVKKLSFNTDINGQIRTNFSPNPFQTLREIKVPNRGKRTDHRVITA